MIRIRPIDKDADDGRISHEDYRLLSGWWQRRTGAAPPRGILPGLGVFAEHDGKPVAAAFCYLDATGSGVAWLGWMITDPAASAARAGIGLTRAIEFLELEARALNYWLASATLDEAIFGSFMERRGYQKTDRGLCHLFKPLPAGDRS